MSDFEGEGRLFIGWDVGGWNCDRRTQKSRDALVAVDQTGNQVGQPWRGNLRRTINEADSTVDFLFRIQDLCRIERSPTMVLTTLAIDAPLGFPEALISLIRGNAYPGSLEKSAENPYLYRFTEQCLFAEGIINPLSSVKDRIGSQSSKAMHAVARFCPQRVEIGVWSDQQFLTVIETYPALCRLRSPTKYIDTYNSPQESDIADARICASVARLFAMECYKLEAPPPDTPESEGWIWAPLSSEGHQDRAEFTK